MKNCDRVRNERNGRGVGQVGGPRRWIQQQIGAECVRTRAHTRQQKENGRRGRSSGGALMRMLLIIQFVNSRYILIVLAEPRVTRITLCSATTPISSVRSRRFLAISTRVPLLLSTLPSICFFFFRILIFYSEGVKIAHLLLRVEFHKIFVYRCVCVFLIDSTSIIRISSIKFCPIVTVTI